MNARAMVATFAACATAGGPGGAWDANPPAEYRIGPEDVLEVSVWDGDGLGRTVPVRPDGMISLPLLDDVPAAGLTPLELRAVLAQRVARFVPGARVSVIVREVHSPKVLVLGEVAHPGRYEVKGPTTVLEMIGYAGGLTEYASRSRIAVYRAAGGAVTRLDVDSADVTPGEARPPRWLRPGDVLLVP